MPTIYVSRAGNSNNLRLRDSESHDPGNDQLETQVSPNDTVTWVKDPNANPPAQPGYSPIGSIVSVTKADSSLPQYANSIQLLIADPAVSNGVATGTVVSTSPGSGRFENYTIGYTLPGETDVLYDDPKLIMR